MIALGGETIKRVEMCREDVLAVKHFLSQNGLLALKFQVPREEYDRAMAMYPGTFPIYLRKYDQSSTVVYIERFFYSTTEQILTVLVRDILEHL